PPPRRARPRRASGPRVAGLRRAACGRLRRLRAAPARTHARRARWSEGGRGMNVRKLDALTFPLSGSRLIEAAAGTGKTWTIAALYLRLVLGHGGDAAFARPLDPPEILVMSFTEAATKELRERIRARLVEAAA